MSVVYFFNNSNKLSDIFLYISKLGGYTFKLGHFFLALKRVSALTTPHFFAGIDFAKTIPLLFDSSPPITEHSFLISVGLPCFSKCTAVHDKNALLTSICIIIFSITPPLTFSLFYYQLI